jgi:hypothetical protein
VNPPELSGDADTDEDGEDAPNGGDEESMRESPAEGKLSTGDRESRPAKPPSSHGGNVDDDQSSGPAQRTPLPGPSSEERVPIGREPRTLREAEKTELPILHVDSDGAVTIGPEPEHVAKLYPTAHGARQQRVGQIGGVYYLRGGERRNGEWATDSTLYEVKIGDSHHFIEIHRRRGIREIPDLEVGRRVFGRVGKT